MEQREKTIRLWFEMWLERRDMGIADIFDPAALYIESWGPEYQGADKIKHWFEEWNRRGQVLIWDIKGFLHGENLTMVEWYFKNAMKNGTVEEFDGVSLVWWNHSGQIMRLQEFGCNIDRYDPYAHGPEPRFRDGRAMWF